MVSRGTCTLAIDAHLEDAKTAALLSSLPLQCSLSCSASL